jgi:FixJ family two-component response regulator
MIPRSLVSVVDDDESVRESLPDLLREFGFTAYSFSSAEDFLASECVGQTNCLILDVGMPGMSGPELQRELKLRQQHIPTPAGRGSSPLTHYKKGCSFPSVASRHFQPTLKGAPFL